MTRENKLALIVGFGLVLFVGILVSDHLSTARRQAAASLGPAGTQPPPIQVSGDRGWLVYGNQDVNASDIPVADPHSHSPHHIVAGGETLRSICRRHYGQPELADMLARYNRLPDANGLTPGTRLLLPPRDQLLATIPAAVPQPQAVPDPIATIGIAANAPPRTASPDNEMGKYTIKSGDTLSELAQQLLGSARKTNELFELNRDVLRHQDDLRVGTTLRYPNSLAR